MVVTTDGPNKVVTATRPLRFNISKNKTVLDANRDIWDFSLTDDEMSIIDGLNTNERKLIPIITLPDGTKEPRDAKDKYYPYAIEY